MQIDGKLSIIPEKMPLVAKEMLTEVIQLQLDGDATKAKAFVDKYREWNDIMQYVSDAKKKLSPKPYKIKEFILADEILSI